MMLSWIERLLSGARLERANERLEEQYKDLTEVENQLDSLQLKLNEAAAVSEEHRRNTIEVSSKISGSMPAVRLPKPERESSDDLFRERLPSRA